MLPSEIKEEINTVLDFCKVIMKGCKKSVFVICVVHLVLMLFNAAFMLALPYWLCDLFIKFNVVFLRYDEEFLHVKCYNSVPMYFVLKFSSLVTLILLVCLELIIFKIKKDNTPVYHFTNQINHLFLIIETGIYYIMSFVWLLAAFWNLLRDPVFIAIIASQVLFTIGMVIKHKTL